MDDTDEDRKAIQAMINQIVFYPLKDFDGKMKTKDAGLARSILASQTLAVAKPRAWTHMIAFAFITCLGIFMILEIEFPRMGFPRIADYDQALVETLDSMK